jgi:uncharacterized membrane protein
MPAKLIRRLARLEAHHRLAISVAVGIIVFLFIGRHTRLPLRLITAWDAYTACVVGLAWNRIFAAQPEAVVRLATLRNTSRIVIFVGVLAAACASLGAVAYLLGSAKDLPVGVRSTHVVLAVATVVLSWVMVHTLFALHYAHQFYMTPQCVQSEPSKRPLLFPGDDLPDYYDFAYFSFVIGMTSQVSDVQIASRGIRRWALLHGAISFAFNTAVLALSINIISGLF